jgi:hypothetical protein
MFNMMQNMREDMRLNAISDRREMNEQLVLQRELMQRDTTAQDSPSFVKPIRCDELQPSAS